METKLDFNNPYLYSSAGKKRKQEIISEFLLESEKLMHHGFSCYVMKKGEGKCEICDKFMALVNILLQEEQKKNMKLDIKQMVKKGIVGYMVYGDGIQFRKKE